jgi:hypothetical protein
MSFKRGDRVRIKNPVSEYTGCRGTIADAAADQPAGVSALGHFVAIDGENGRTRPFLAKDLEMLTAARVRGRSARDAAGDNSPGGE